MVVLSDTAKRRALEDGFSQGFIDSRPQDVAFYYCARFDMCPEFYALYTRELERALRCRGEDEV